MEQKSSFSLEQLKHHFKRGTWKVMVPLLLALVSFVLLAIKFSWNLKVVAAVAFAIGLISNIFLWLLSLVALTPLVGPLIVKVLALPFVWVVNGLGYLVSFVAIRRGYSRDVITYRALTIALLIGIVIGFVLGSLL